ncbi:hypothetical protein CI610_00298 [invertebrate metagenome]|uniref:Uncharacterized protein n=1 Tax=invertebrate metagenome TaxID=1711999 RepID=A0A2H9TBS5_9ZZZZ
MIIIRIADLPTNRPNQKKKTQPPNMGKELQPYLTEDLIKNNACIRNNNIKVQNIIETYQQSDRFQYSLDFAVFTQGFQQIPVSSSIYDSSADICSYVTFFSPDDKTCKFFSQSNK